MNTVVLGAGISGLTAAFSLSQLPGETYSVYERDLTPGGLCRTLEQDGFTFDSISHVLHFRTREAEQLVHTLLGGNLLKDERSAWIYFRQRYVPYPFQTHLGFLPFLEGATCLAGYWRAWLGGQRNGHREPQNFGDWIQQQFGASIARHFMIPYNTKLWGLPPEEMSVDWVRSFVPRISSGELMASWFSKRTNNGGYNGCLYYPVRGGMQALVDGLSARVSELHLNHRAVEINLERKNIRFEHGREASYDRLISTIPLKTLILHAVGLPDELRAAARELRSTSLLNITFCVRRPLPHRFHWVYFPEPQYPFFRLVFPSNVCPSLAPPNCSIISAEISDPERSQEDTLKEQTRELLLRLGLVHGASDIAFVVSSYFDHAYPVHDLKRASLVEKLLQFLKSRSVWSIGRFGGWRYSSIDDTIVEALQAVREATEVTPLRRAVGAAAGRWRNWSKSVCAFLPGIHNGFRKRTSPSDISYAVSSRICWNRESPSLQHSAPCLDQTMPACPRSTVVPGQFSG